MWSTISYYLQQAQADGAPHIDRRMSPADEQVGEQIDDGNKCCLLYTSQVVDAFPFVRNLHRAEQHELFVLRQ